MTIELRHLTTFLAVADTGGIGLAARRLGHAQSAVSRRIGQLERELGVTLLERHRSGVELTRAGHALANTARPAVAAIESSIDNARRRAARLNGTITLGVFPYMLEQIGELLGELRVDHPDVDVAVRQVDFTNQLLDVLEGRADAVVLTWAPGDPRLELQRLSRYPLYVILSDHHRLANRRSLRFDDIAEEPWPRAHPTVPQEWADHLYMTDRRGRRPPLTPEAPLTPDETWPLVAAGRAITTIPEFIAPLAQQIHGITALPLEDGDPLVLTLARRRENPPSPLLDALFAAAARIYTSHQASETRDSPKTPVPALDRQSARSSNRLRT